MLRSLKNWILVFVLLFVSVAGPFWMYNNNTGPDLVSSFHKISVSYLQLFTCDPLLDDSKNVTTVNTTKQDVHEHCLPNTTVWEFVKQQCSRIHLYLPVEKQVRSVNATVAHSRMARDTADYLPDQAVNPDENETDVSVRGGENETEVNVRGGENLTNQSEAKNDSDLNEVRRLPVPRDEGERDSPDERDWNESREQLGQVFEQLGIAIRKAAFVLSNHVILYPKDVCVVVVFLLSLMKMASLMAGSSRRLAQVTPRSASILSTASGRSDVSDEELVKPEMDVCSEPQTLESVRHLLPAESQPTMSCGIVVRQGTQSASSSETCNMRGIPDTFTILKNMPADIDVADIYLDTFRRMALQAGKIKTANLLKESQLFLEYRRNSYIKSNEQQNVENATLMIPADSVIANPSTGSED